VARPKSFDGVESASIEAEIHCVMAPTEAGGAVAIEGLAVGIRLAFDKAINEVRIARDHVIAGR